MAVPTSVAAVVTLVPEGLILLASVTYAVAALRMARRGALAQQLNAIESLASVDVVCLDKTGTLTGAAPRVLRLVPADGVGEDEVTARAAASAADPQRDARGAPGGLRRPRGPRRLIVPFSSRRRLERSPTDGHWIVVGAPELFELGCSRLAEARRPPDAVSSRSASSPSNEPDL